jgi:hypothetical protein
MRDYDKINEVKHQVTVQSEKNKHAIKKYFD